MALQIISNFRKPYKEVLQEPDERLRMVSEKVREINNTVITVADELKRILKAVDRLYIPWLGMTAPQIGYNLRIIAVKKSYGTYQIMVNPELLDQRWLLPAISGCYSLRGLYLLKSPYWLKLKYTDLKNKTHSEIFYGGMAVLLKQEVDHLEGKLVCD